MAEIVKEISESRNMRTLKYCRTLPFQSEVLKPLRDFGIFEGGVAMLTGTPPFVWNSAKQADGFTILWFVLAGHIAIENEKGMRMEGKQGALLLRPSTESQRITSYEREFEHLYFKLKQPNVPGMTSRAAVNMEDLRNLVEMLWLEYSIRRRNFSEMLYYLCGLIRILVERNLAGEKTSMRIEKLFQLLEESPGEKWTVQRLARAMNMSPSLLYKLCCQNCGMGPSRLIQKVKMLHAYGLLCNGGETLEEIAASLGYSSAFAFSKVFTKFYGRRPGQVRRDRNNVSCVLLRESDIPSGREDFSSR